MNAPVYQQKHFSIIRQHGIKFLLSIILVFLISSQLEAQYVHTDGTKIVDANGEDIYFSGMNLGNWLLWEGYLMMGDFQYRTHTQFLNSMAVAFGNDMAKAREFEHQWRMNYVTQQAMDDLKELGYNSVRVPFHYNMFWDGSAVKDDGFQYFDRVIEFCKANDMYVLLDMHAAPGYQNPGDHCDNLESDAGHPDGTVHFWEGDNVNIAAEVWKHIASHYATEPTVWGYDLINEPVPSELDKYKLLPSMITMRNAIREVDNNHIIVAEGSWWGSDMEPLDWTSETVQLESGVSSRWDDNMVYQTHHYSTDVSLLEGRLEICNDLDVPMILGEYGESDMTNLRNMTDWCIDNSVDYFPWSFKKMSHDKCLWTIEPNAAYEELKAAITAGTTGPSTLYDDMIDFCHNNIANGAEGLVWDQSFYDATKMPCSVGTPSITVADADITGTSIKVKWTNVSGEAGYNVKCSDGQSATLAADATTYTFTGLENDTKYTISVAAYTDDCVGNSGSIDAKTLCVGGQTPYTGSAIVLPGTIEGENYDAGCDAYFDLSDGNTGGLYREDDVDITDGVDGGYAVGWIDATEWLEYTVNVAYTGTFDIDFVVASPDGTGEIQLQVDDEILATMLAPNTGDWGVYDTASTKISLIAGTQEIRLVFSGALNFDKLTIKEERDPSYLERIEVTPSNSTIYVGESLSLTATGYSQYNEVYPITTAWSATGGVISQSGVFTGNNAGTYTITAAVGNIDASASVTVNEVPACTPNVPGTFEAEEYTDMSGIQTENTTDDGGGINVGWIDAGDWLEYSDICVATNGSYTIEARIASQSNGGQFEVQDQNGNVLVTVDVPVTGGWQNWESVNETLELASSITTLKLVVTQGGFNINWFEFTTDNSGGVIDVSGVSISSTTISLELGATSSLAETVSPTDATDQSVSWSSDNNGVATVSSSGLVSAISTGSANITVTTNDGGFSASCAVTVIAEIEEPISIIIEAEDYFESSGIQTESCSEGTLNVGWTDGGDWMGYSVDIPSSGTYTVEYRVASQNGGGQLQLEQFGGGDIYGNLDIPSTGGWQNWTTISHTVTLSEGVQDIAIAVNNGGWNLNWFKITSSSVKSVGSDTDYFNNSISNIVVYPNPAHNMLFIKGVGEQATIEVYSVSGKKVIENFGNSIDVSELAVGVYYLRILYKNSIEQVKFIKQ